MILYTNSAGWSSVNWSRMSEPPPQAPPSPDGWERPPRKKLRPLPGNVLLILVAKLIGPPRKLPRA